MKREHLVPLPSTRRRFRLAEQKFVPALSGCYVLTTFEEDVLYVGLAVDLRRRMGEHLEDPLKTATTPFGRAFWFYWVETANRNQVERTWMNIHVSHEGRYPVLNRMYSPTAV